MKEYIECYANDNHATPILGKRECLENHEQYICGTCGRCICCQKDDKRQLRRIDFPFKSLAIAKLYLRVADHLYHEACGIYEVISESKRKSYKIFVDDTSFKEYLRKSKKSAEKHQALYRNPNYQEFTKTRIRKLYPNEIDEYLRKG
ncbi:hypothetical protein G15_2159 [Enterococcus avium]|uniref:hypothetical protein n=1 Tax=Enterococcus malodoratus TaxID=71451 RepID=UPI0008B0FCFC|nr:hypothetical protein [Enterococcus malodoratus]BBM18494.1 hypothetical protein G15_2159 [Enterococcus avium]SET91683.1 hypothetical protein SAMN04487821_1294 [Enterococcus malodoratus]